MAQKSIFATLAAIVPLVIAQQIGTVTPEVHPQLPTWKCTTSGGCVQQNTSVVLDWGFHAINSVSSPSTSCTTSSGGVSSSLCPSEATCAQNCAVEGANYAQSGVSVSGNALTLREYLNLTFSVAELFLCTRYEFWH
jgi:cellulase